MAIRLGGFATPAYVDAAVGPVSNLPFGGDGSLGALSVSADLEIDGEKQYSSVTVDNTKKLGPTPGKVLWLRVSGNLTLTGSGSIDADGRGQIGGYGGAGGTLTSGTKQNGYAGVQPASTPDGVGFTALAGGSGGGGSGYNENAGSGSGAGGSGDVTTGSRHYMLTGSAGTAGTGAASQGNSDTNGISASVAGTSPASADGIISNLDRRYFSRQIPSSTDLYRMNFVGGQGGCGGGGGGSHKLSGQTIAGASGGTPGSQSSGGNGGTGGAGANNSGAACGGGAGGAGGGVVIIEVAGNLSISTGYISADGGNGGTGGSPSGDLGYYNGIAGGGGGGGGGGLVALYYNGTLTGTLSSTNVHATAGSAGSGGTKSGAAMNYGGNGSAGAAGEAGIVIFQKVV